MDRQGSGGAGVRARLGGDRPGRLGPGSRPNPEWAGLRGAPETPAWVRQDRPRPRREAQCVPPRGSLGPRGYRCLPGPRQPRDREAARGGDRVGWGSGATLSQGVCRPSSGH